MYLNIYIYIFYLWAQLVHNSLELNPVYLHYVSFLLTFFSSCLFFFQIKTCSTIIPTADVLLTPLCFHSGEVSFEFIDLSIGCQAIHQKIHSHLCKAYDHQNYQNHGQALPLHFHIQYHHCTKDCE